jgi:hypothetical protein
MIYRGPGFLIIEWFGSSPPSLPNWDLSRTSSRVDPLGGGGGGVIVFFSHSPSQVVWFGVWIWVWATVVLELRIFLKQKLERWRITPSRKHNGFFCSFFFFAFHKDSILFMSCYVLVGGYGIIFCYCDGIMRRFSMLQMHTKHLSKTM